MHTTPKHKFRTIPFVFVLIGLVILTAACQPSAQTQTEQPDALVVTVSILPQAYFVERIGGDAVAINTMVGKGEDAHTYEPKPDQMRALNDSEVFFSIGVEYEASWIPRFRDNNPDMLVVNSATGIEKIVASAHQDDSHDEDDHSGEADPHVWLAPENGKIIAENIFNTLVELAPEHADDFQANFDALIADIDALDTEIQSSLSELDSRVFMVFHPAWGYFAAQYNLEEIAVQIGGQDPSPRELAELVDLARKENIRVIFVQPTFSTADAEAIADEIDAQIAFVDPLARNWLENLNTAAQAFAAALKQ